MALSFAVGITFAVIMLVVFVRVTSQVLIQQKAKEDSRRRHLLAKIGEKMTQQEDDIRPEDKKVNPFVMPLILIDVILVTPIRKRFANSLRRFTQEWVVFSVPDRKSKMIPDISAIAKVAPVVPEGSQRWINEGGGVQR